MIYIIIGCSCSGKSTLVKNTFLNEPIIKFYKDITQVTETEHYFLIGNYQTNKRRVGTDTLERKDIKFIGEQINKLYGLGKDIIAEGTRCCTHNLMNTLLKYKDCKLIYLDTSIENSLERNVKLGYTSSDKSLKHDVTMCRNFWNKYGSLLNGVRIDTNEIDDFSEFKYSNELVNNYKIKENTIFNL